jgi:hypothetical protein
MPIMNTALRAGLGLLLCCAGSAPAAAAEKSRTGGDICENAVAETVRRMRGRNAQEVTFVGSKRTLSAMSDDDETSVKGAGHYRGAAGGAMPFTYTCAFNAKTGSASGVLIRDRGTARAEAENPWQPDLTHLSPEACEVATATLLKEKYPRVGRIAFGSDSRQLRPAPNDRTSLEGQGAVVRAPGMHSVPFSYRCEVETRSGKVVAVRTSE